MVITRSKKGALGALGALALAAIAVFARGPAETGLGAVPGDSPGITTSAADLSGLSLGDLQAKDADALAPFIQTVLAQVGRPVLVLGGSNPPTRYD